MCVIFTYPKDGKESNYIKRKTEEFPEENERSAGKKSSTTNHQLIQKDVKGTDDVPVKENFEQFNAMQQKQDELNNEQKDEKQYSKSSKSKSQKSQHKQPKKKADNNSQDNDLLCHSNPNIDNQLEQEDGKHDVMDQLQSNKDYQHAQDDSKKTNDSGSDVRKKCSSQAKKVSFMQTVKYYEVLFILPVFLYYHVMFYLCRHNTVPAQVELFLLNLMCLDLKLL